jgi:hypothetical protein
MRDIKSLPVDLYQDTEPINHLNTEVRAITDPTGGINSEERSGGPIITDPTGAVAGKT